MRQRLLKSFSNDLFWPKYLANVKFGYCDFPRPKVALGKDPLCFFWLGAYSNHIYQFNCFKKNITRKVLLKFL